MPGVIQPFDLQTGDGLVLRGEIWGGDNGEPGSSAVDKPVLTFIHGTGLNVRCYIPAFRSILGRARVFALNARGHGGSQVQPSLTGWEHPLADLRRLITTRLQPPVILAGHSYGALLSLQIAAEHPELAAGLILLDPLVPWRRDEDWPPVGAGPDREIIERARTRRHTWSSRTEAETWLGGRGIFERWAAEPFELFLESGLAEMETGEVGLVCPPWVEVASYLGRPQKVVFDWAERIRVPVVILRGSDSSVTSGVEDFADATAVCVVLTVRGDHTFANEHPGETGVALSMALDILTDNSILQRRTTQMPK